MEIAKKNDSKELLYWCVLQHITKNQDNPMKTIGWDSFLSPKKIYLLWIITAIHLPHSTDLVFMVSAIEASGTQASWCAHVWPSCKATQVETDGSTSDCECDRNVRRRVDRWRLCEAAADNWRYEEDSQPTNADRSAGFKALCWQTDCGNSWRWLSAAWRYNAPRVLQFFCSHHSSQLHHLYESLRVYQQWTCTASARR